MNDLDENESLIIKLFYLLGFSLSFINSTFDLVFATQFLLSKLLEEINSVLPIFRAIPIIILYWLLDYECVDKNIMEYVVWYFQILNNIIFNNKYTYPLFYIIFFTLDKIIFNFFIIRKENDNSPIPIFKLLVFIGISIIIIYMQAFYGPRFMLNSKYQEKNQIYYLSRKELLKKKPKTKKENCSICLIPFLDKNKTKKDNEISFNDNDIEIKNKYKGIFNKIKEFFELNFGHEDIKIYKEFMKSIIKKSFFDFYEYDNKLLRKYMLIPCGHAFHSNCLEKWIEIERKCPLCRRPIPFS